MKKRIFAFILLLALVLLSGCGQTDRGTTTTPSPKPITVTEPTDFEEWVKWSITKQFGSKVKVTKITINDHMGTSKPDDKIALIYVDYTDIDTQKLKRHTDQMFKTVYDRYPLYQEFVVFWAPDGDKRATFKVYNERSETIYNP